MNYPRVLAITKHLPMVCGAQSLLYGAGFELVTATNMAAARSCIRAMQVKGAIVCLGSWSDQELENIAAELAADFPEVKVVYRCPGCITCDEPTRIPVLKTDRFALAEFIIAITPAA